MDVPIPVVVATISLIGVTAQVFIADRSRRQLAAQSQETMAIQRLVSHRSTAAFVADKRQKWIDELRIDMAFHLAQSQEMAWKWDAVRCATALAVQTIAHGDPVKKEQIQQDAADNFSKVYGELDRSHQERHFRIKFRLNPNEDLHIRLRESLDEIRTTLRLTQGAESFSEAKELLKRMKVTVDSAARLTEQVLKFEWQRVKQEVAYPESLIATIPDPSNA